MTAVELKKELIRKVINPFFKTNGFVKKGVTFYQDLSYFQIEADIQSQRYYKEKNIEKFRINYGIFCNNFIQKCGHKEYIEKGFISQETSWISLDSETQIDSLSTWLQEELSKITELIERYSNISNIDKIIDQFRDTQDVIYAFLLQEFNKNEDLAEWKVSRNDEKARYLNQIKGIEEEKRNIENRPNSLDKKVRLEGVEMKLRNLNYKIKTIDKEIQMITNCP